MSTKVFRAGTHRVRAPEETRARIWPLLRAMGITRVANITGLDCIGIPVVAAYRPNARSLSVAQGKGASLVAAEVSGAMESIESYHAEHVVRPLLHASYNQLRFSHRVLDPELLPRSAVGRFSIDRKIHWIEGFDLIQDEPCWVPYELVHTDFTLPLPADSGCFPMSSNGLASGNDLQEAISHAICELVERDADALFALLSPEERAQRVLRLDTLAVAECEPLFALFAKARVRVAVWNMTSDIGIAAFRAVIMDEELNPDRPLRPHVGMGCHPSRAIALSRALTEAAQARLTVISSARDDLSRARYSEASDFDKLRALRAAESAGAPACTFSDVPEFESDDLGQDVSWETERLVRSGVKHVVAVDLTKPEFGIPVVRVIAPGLEAPRDIPGWLPGRRARALAARTEA